MEPPPLPGQGPAVEPLRFMPGMSGRELLGIIFRVCREMRVSDIQMRAERPVYIHTNKGMEKLEALGELSAANMDEILKELIANRESGSHGFGQTDSLEERVEDKIQRAIADFQQTRVADFSCDGIPMGDNGERSGRLRIQAHLSSSGLGVTCRILNDYIPELESLGIDPDTIATLRHSVLKRAGLCLVTGPTGSGKSTTLASLIDWVRRNHPKH
ncbi:MAG TPA: ATPase, T2SS/T4P/T4SS family, partial [Luteolibacter sp.]|nr:ATPase, T2SS/T4P/T4SS family [Luteolibacter sp.]